MSNIRISTAVTHLLLIVLSLWCLAAYFKTDEQLYPACIAFVVILINSVIGIVRYGFSLRGTKVIYIFNISSFWNSCIVLPLFNITLIILYKLNDVFIYIHLLELAAAVMHRCLKLKHQYKLHDVLIFLNIASLMTISILNLNYYGISVAISFGINHKIGDQGTVFEVPAQNLHNLGMCFTCVFMYNALRD